jgi:hypothetical protein
MFKGKPSPLRPRKLLGKMPCSPAVLNTIATGVTDGVTRLHDGVALLVGDVEPLAARVDGEVAWKIDALRGEPDHREQARRGIDAIADDAVVSAVGGIEELAGEMDRDFGRAVPSVVPGGFGSR